VRGGGGSRGEHSTVANYSGAGIIPYNPPVAEDKGKEEEKFDFTDEGEGYISLAEARVLATRTAVESPGDYGRNFRNVSMVFEVAESGEDDDYYTVTLSVRPQGSFDGTPGQEQFFIGKEGTIAVRQLLSSPTQTSASPAGTASRGSGFPMLPVAIGVVIVGAIAAVGAVVILMSSGGDNVPIAAVAPTERPTPTQPPAPTETLATTETPALTPMPTSTPYPTPTPRPTYTPRPIPTPTYTPRPTTRPTYTPRPIPTPTPSPTPRPTPRPTPTATPLSYYLEGSRLHQLGLYDAAILNFTEAIKYVKNNPDAYKLRGSSYLELGNYRLAISDLSEAESYIQDDMEIYRMRGKAKNALGIHHSAIPDFDKVISNASAPQISDYHNRGVAHYNIDAFWFAITDFTKTLEVEPTAERYELRGVSYYQTGAGVLFGQYSKAISDLDQSIRLEPTGPRYYWRSLAHSALDQLDQAEDDAWMACAYDRSYC